MASSFEEAKSANSAATQMLRTVADGKLSAGQKAPDAGATFDAAPSRQYGKNAFDQKGGPRTTD
jgi:hypothetical protein